MITRASSEELNNILGNEFKVLDHGLIRVIDYMGNDSAIVQAARVSYGEGTKKVSEDRGLIRYLIRHRHTSPLEMCEIKLHIKCPIYVWRQWIRHRTASVNEVSGRYSVMTDEMHNTKSQEWRSQSKDNKQGSGDFIDINNGISLSTEEKIFLTNSRNVYNNRLENGVAREQARKDLPLSTYTEAYWKIDLHNLLHFLSLRMDSHAQLEIREYANIIGNEIVAKWCPIVWEAFQDYRLNSVHLTKVDIDIIQYIIQNGLKFSQPGGVSKREYNECLLKIEKIGLDKELYK